MVQLELEQKEVEAVLEALAYRPYIQVVNVIDKIMAQLNAQHMQQQKQEEGTWPTSPEETPAEA